MAAMAAREWRWVSQGCVASVRVEWKQENLPLVKSYVSLGLSVQQAETELGVGHRVWQWAKGEARCGCCMLQQPRLMLRRSRSCALHAGLRWEGPSKRVGSSRQQRQQHTRHKAPCQRCCLHTVGCSRAAADTLLPLLLR